MRKTSVALLVGLLSIGLALPAHSAPKSSVVTAAFKTLLNTTVNSMDALDEKYEADVDLLDAALASAKQAANAVLAEEIQAATALYSPQIAAANQRLEAARVLFKNNSDLKIDRSLFSSMNKDRVYIHLICPETTLPAGAGWMEIAKTYCSNVNKLPRPGDVSTKTTSKNSIGGEDWQPGEIAKIDLYSVDNKDLLGAVSSGWLIPVSPALFDSSRLAIASETGNVADLTQKNGRARVAAETKAERAIQTANTVRDEALADLDEAYEGAKIQLEAQETAASLALLAAKRASRDVNVFDSAFAVAYKFEYNRLMVGEIADAAWTGEWTFRTIDSIMKVNRLAVSGDSVASRYSMSSARAFNSVVGNAFTNEPEFRSALKVLTSIYKKTTKVSLKV